MIDNLSVPHLPGVTVLDTDGALVGSVDRVYIHQTTGAPLWVSVQTLDAGRPYVFAPLDAAYFDDQPGAALHLNLTSTILDGAPVIDARDALTRDDVQALRNYYPATAPHSEGTPAGGDVDLIRYEEHLQVRTIPMPVERVRFEKVIVTEERTITVTVRREELRTTREPITPSDHTQTSPPSAVIGQDIEVVLHEEQIEVTTKVIPVERVRIRVGTVVEQLPVTDTVRKERVDISTGNGHPDGQ